MVPRCLTPRIGHVLYLRQLGNFASICLSPLFLRRARSIVRSFNLYPFSRCSRCWIWSNIRAFFWLCVRASYLSSRMRVSTGVRRNGNASTARMWSEAVGVAVVSTHSQIVQRRLDQRNSGYVHGRFYSRKLKYLCLPAMHDLTMFCFQVQVQWFLLLSKVIGYNHLVYRRGSHGHQTATGPSIN